MASWSLIANRKLQSSPIVCFLPMDNPVSHLDLDSDSERDVLRVHDIMLVLYATPMETSRFHWTIGIVIGVNSIIKYHVYERIPDVWEYEAQHEEIFDPGVLVTCLRIGTI